MSIKILLIEDEKHIRDTVKAFLIDAGYNVDTCSDGESGLTKFYDNKYDLLIIDIMLPKISGHELLKEFRKINNTPIIMMTALSDEENEIKAFDLEADDYIKKPFKIALLLKRVEALLRRSGALEKSIKFEKLILFPEDFRAIYDEVEISLTPKEFEILVLLVKNKNKTITHEIILSRVWGYDFDGDVTTLHTHIKNLRIKLPDNIIKTVRGIGYKLEEKN